MLFNTLQFALFFLAVLALYRSAPPRHRAGVLLAASLVFYTLWVPAYLLLLLADVGVNYLLIRWMARSERRRVPLVLACVFTLGLLAWFKYAAMIVESLLPVLAGPLEAGGFTLSVPEVFLPLGISFYSFQILGLAVDTYRGRTAPVDDFRRYLLFVCFFPQLIAGPILRGHEFLPQLERGGITTPERTRRGLWLIGSGVVKKVVLADFLLAPFVDEVFTRHAPPEAVFHWVAAYSFAFQIYYDFSGYTDMARGMGLLLGFELPLNFREPYLSRNPIEQWERWHITLSRWLSDYLYIPLGGNRVSRPRNHLNLMLTMLLGGLWHGASWTYVLWGAACGLFLVVHRALVRRRPVTTAPLRWMDAPKIWVTFHVWVVTFTIFRCIDIDHALQYLRVLFSFNSPYAAPWVQIGVVVLCAVLHFVERLARPRLPALRERLGSRPWGPALEGACLGGAFGLASMVSGVGGDFIYFQF